MVMLNYQTMTFQTEIDKLTAKISKLKASNAQLQKAQKSDGDDDVDWSALYCHQEPSAQNSDKKQSQNSAQKENFVVKPPMGLDVIPRDDSSQQYSVEDFSQYQNPAWNIQQKPETPQKEQPGVSSGLFNVLKSENEDLKQKQEQFEKEIHYLQTANANLMQEVNWKVSEIENYKKWNMDCKKDLELRQANLPISLSNQNHEHILQELTKGLEIYRGRLVTMISTIRGTDYDKQKETDTVIEELTQEMQTYSMLLIKTQMTLDFKEKESQGLRMEMEQISMSCKDSVKVGGRKKDEEILVQIKEKDVHIGTLQKRVSEVVREKKSLQKEFDEVNKNREELEGQVMKVKLESDLLKEHIERLNESLKEQDKCFELERSELEIELSQKQEQLRVVCLSEGKNSAGQKSHDGSPIHAGIPVPGSPNNSEQNFEVALLKKKLGVQEKNILSLNMNIESISKENFDLQNKLKDSIANLEASRNEFENLKNTFAKSRSNMSGGVDENSPGIENDSDLKTDVKINEGSDEILFVNLQGDLKKTKDKLKDTDAKLSELENINFNLTRALEESSICFENSQREFEDKLSMQLMGF